MRPACYSPSGGKQIFRWRVHNHITDEIIITAPMSERNAKRWFDPLLVGKVEEKAKPQKRKASKKRQSALA
jgi:hypothetical protein